MNKHKITQRASASLTALVDKFLGYEWLAIEKQNIEDTLKYIPIFGDHEPNMDKFRKKKILL